MYCQFKTVWIADRAIWNRKSYCIGTFIATLRKENIGHGGRVKNTIGSTFLLDKANSTLRISTPWKSDDGIYSCIYCLITHTRGVQRWRLICWCWDWRRSVVTNYFTISNIIAWTRITKKIRALILTIGGCRNIFATVDGLGGI